MEGDGKAVVMDLGSSIIKTGYAGDEVPKSVVPTVIGRPLPSRGVVGSDPSSGILVGDDAVRQRNGLSLTYPMEHGVVKDWHLMETLISHVLHKDLKTNPETRPVLLTEAARNPFSNRERLTELMFETFKVPAMYVAIQGLLAVYSSGRICGIAVDCGEHMTVMAVDDGYIPQHAITRVNFGGRDLTAHLQALLTERGHHEFSSTTAGFETVRDVKEKLCYVGMEYESEVMSAQCSSLEKSYELPDGQVITIRDQRFRCAEVLFQPTLMQLEHLSLPMMIDRTIMKCDIDRRPDFYANIMLSGGTTCFEGLQQRLLKEMKYLASSELRVQVHAPPERKYSVWIGGSILSSLDTFSHWVMKETYEETGPTVTRECF